MERFCQVLFVESIEKSLSKFFNLVYLNLPMDNTLDVQKGSVLLAQPFMVDSHFKRSVILMCEHTDMGSVGFILNKTLKVKVSDLIADFPDFEANAWYGGPVQNDTIHYLHNLGDLLEDSQEVAKGIYWGGDFEKLKFLINSKLVTPANIRFFVGYSGWSAGQLVEELDYGSWLTAEMNANYLFKKLNPKKLWSLVMQNKGHNYSVIAQLPEIVSWN